MYKLSTVHKNLVDSQCPWSPCIRVNYISLLTVKRFFGPSYMNFIIFILFFSVFLLPYFLSIIFGDFICIKWISVFFFSIQYWMNQ